MTIKFYSTNEQWAFLSNFSRHGFLLNDLSTELHSEPDQYWMTVEHYFQAAKFFPTDAEYAEQVRIAETPQKAKTLGRSRKHPLREDWDDVKEQFMRAALVAKFRAHDEIRLRLLATGEQQLVEDAPADYYWGCGRTGAGKNRLGVLLMEVREQLRRESEHRSD